MTRRLLVIAVALSLVAGLAALLALADGPRAAVGKMRADFIALRCLRDAVDAATGRPINRHLAISKLTRALQLAPDHPAVIASAPEIYITVGAYKQAASQLARQPVPNPYLTGICLLKLDQKEKGAQMLLHAAQLAKHNYALGKLDTVQYAMQLNNAGYLLIDAGVKLDKAEAMLGTATDILPLDANCVDSLGWLYYRLGEMRKAVFYLERAVRLQLRPGEPEIYYHLGAAYARDGRHARATKLLRMALRWDPHHEEAQRELDRLNWLLPPPTLVDGTTRATPAGT